MVYADPMPEDLILELVTRAQRDQEVWGALKDREQSQFNNDGSAKIPSTSMLIREFVKRELGADHNYDYGALVIPLRYQIRKELGLPVNTVKFPRVGNLRVALYVVRHWLRSLRRRR